MKKLNILFLSLALAFVASCSSTKEEQLNPSAETLYNQAYEQLQQTSYKKAAQTFEKGRAGTSLFQMGSESQINGRLCLLQKWRL